MAKPSTEGQKNKQLYKKAIGEPKLGEAHKNISKPMNITWRTIKLVIQKLKEYGTANLSRALSLNTEQASEVREDVKKHVTTMKRF